MAEDGWHRAKRERQGVGRTLGTHRQSQAQETRAHRQAHSPAGHAAGVLLGAHTQEQGGEAGTRHREGRCRERSSCTRTGRPAPHTNVLRASALLAQTRRRPPPKAARHAASRGGARRRLPPYRAAGPRAISAPRRCCCCGRLGAPLPRAAALVRPAAGCSARRARRLRARPPRPPPAHSSSSSSSSAGSGACAAAASSASLRCCSARSICTSGGGRAISSTKVRLGSPVSLRAR